MTFVRDEGPPSVLITVIRVDERNSNRLPPVHAHSVVQRVLLIIRTHTIARTFEDF